MWNSCCAHCLREGPGRFPRQPASILISSAHRRPRDCTDGSQVWQARMQVRTPQRNRKLLGTWAPMVVDGRAVASMLDGEAHPSRICVPAKLRISCARLSFSSARPSIHTQRMGGLFRRGGSRKQGHASAAEWRQLRGGRVRRGKASERNGLAAAVTAASDASCDDSCDGSCDGS